LGPILDKVQPVPCGAVDAAVAPAAVANPTSLFVADEYDVKVGVVGDNFNTYKGANVNCMVIPPYKLVSTMNVDALPPRSPSHCRIV
jgi:hypothetical protein